MNGEYQLTSIKPEDGAKPGEYSVVVTAVKTVADGPVPKTLEEELAGVGENTRYSNEFLANPKYGSRLSSDLTATVKESGENRIDFDLEP